MEITFETIGTNTFFTCLIPNDELDMFSIKMLEHNEIKGILPFSGIQENANRKIRYTITSYETLESYIRRPLPLARILNILESIARTAMELEEYMLSMDGIALKTEYMYTEIRNGETKLIYLPVKKKEKTDVFQFLRELLGRVQYETPESAVCILKISNDINSGKINGLDSFLEAIREARETGKEDKKRQNRSNLHTDTKLEKAAVKEAEILLESPVPNVVPAPNTVAEPIFIPSVEEKEEKKKGKKPFGLFSAEKKEKESAKAKKKKENGKTVTPGFAIPGADPVFDSPRQLQREEVVEKPQISIEKKGLFGKKKKEKAEPLEKEVKQPERISAEAVQVSQQQRIESVSERKLDFGNTIIFQPESEMTMVEGYELLQEPGIPYILRRANGQKMYLEQEITKIGRESAYVDFYIGDNRQIGRSHAEIIQRGKQFFLKDNHSKNHTYINGRMLAGEEEVLLRNGDVFSLSNDAFEYHE